MKLLESQVNKLKVLNGATDVNSEHLESESDDATKRFREETRVR